MFFQFPDLVASAPWLVLRALLLYIASFAIGLGRVFWLVVSEIYHLRVRSTAMSARTAANFVVSVTFLSLVEWMSRPGPFFLYAGIGVLDLVCFWRQVPEAKGRSLEEIQQDLTRPRRS